MKIGDVGMAVDERLMPMGVGVTLCERTIMAVPMVFIVGVKMLVIQHFVSVNVAMALVKEQRDAGHHRSGCDQIERRRKRPKDRNRQGRSDEGCGSEVGGLPRGAQVAKRLHAEEQA